ncbi:MAG TPA: hypothetical protein VFQ24_12735 [Terriglobia bacterium]|nr:hypothetical protein [Terriglobia bacterium]
MLHAKDLAGALLLAEKHMGAITGRAFNIGGGPANSISLLQVLELSGEICGPKPRFTVGPSTLPRIFPVWPSPIGPPTLI